MTGSRTLPVAGVLFCVVLLFAGCADEKRPSAPEVTRQSAAAAPTSETFKAMESPSMQFLPRMEQAPGWRLETDPLVVPAAQLGSYLDVDAAHFKSYGVLDLTVGSYLHLGAPGFATVEIFRFPDFVKAFGAYSTRRTGAVALADIPNESFVAAHSVHVWRGPFYVRITGGPSPEVIAAMRTLATSVAAGMPPAPGKPAVFKFLPDGRIPNSEQFNSGPGLGQPFLAGAFTADYNLNGKPVNGLIIPAAGKPDAARILNQFRSFFAANGRLLDPVPNLGEDNLTGEDRNFGRVVAFRLDRFVVVFRGYGDRQSVIDLAIGADQRILGSIRKELQIEDTRREEGDDTAFAGAAVNQ